MDKDLKIS